MEDALGERWGDLSFEDAEIFLGQPDADGLSFIAIAIDSEDEGNLAKVQRVISSAKRKDIKVILITEDVSPASLHQLLRDGGDEFVP